MIKQKGFSKIIIIVIVLAVVAGGILLWQYWPEQVEQEIVQEEIYDCEAEICNQQTNDINNALLIYIARIYLKANPQIYLDLEPLSAANQAHFDNVGFSPDWFLTHSPDAVDYNAPNEHSAPYDYLNDKFVVYWRFIPGCEKKLETDGRWLDEHGLPCLGGYGINIVLSGDLKEELADIQSLRELGERLNVFSLWGERLDIGSID